MASRSFSSRKSTASDVAEGYSSTGSCISDSEWKTCKVSLPGVCCSVIKSLAALGHFDSGNVQLCVANDNWQPDDDFPDIDVDSILADVTDELRFVLCDVRSNAVIVKLFVVNSYGRDEYLGPVIEIMYQSLLGAEDKATLPIL